MSDSVSSRVANMAAPPPGLPPPSSIDDLLTIYDLKIDTKSSQVSLSSPAPADSAVAADLAATLATINELAPLLARGPFPHCPPPPPPPPFINPQTANIPNPRAAQVAKVRTDGNNAFNKGDFGRAVDLYSLAAEMAATRPLFEHSAWVKEELSVVLCNRCAAYQSMKKYTEALADAETVISLKNNWSKGHFRKAKTLQAMQRWDAALDATLLGLEFEPTNKVRPHCRARVSASDAVDPIGPLDAGGPTPGIPKSETRRRRRASRCDDHDRRRRDAERELSTYRLLFHNLCAIRGRLSSGGRGRTAGTSGSGTRTCTGGGSGGKGRLSGSDALGQRKPYAKQVDDPEPESGQAGGCWQDPGEQQEGQRQGVELRRR